MSEYYSFSIPQAGHFLRVLNRALNEKYLNGTLENGEKEFSDVMFKVMINRLTKKDHSYYNKLARSYIDRDDQPDYTVALWKTPVKEAKPASRES